MLKKKNYWEITAIEVSDNNKLFYYAYVNIIVNVFRRLCVKFQYIAKWPSISVWYSRRSRDIVTLIH